jgi:thiol:disulfide interchange protein DsbC
MDRRVSTIAGRALLALALAPVLPAAALAQCPTAEQVGKAIKDVFKRDITVKKVSPGPLKSLCEVQVNFQGRPNILYTDATGAFLVTGHVMDAKSGKDLTEEALAVLQSLTPADMEKLASLATLTLGTKGPVVYFATDPM